MKRSESRKKQKEMMSKNKKSSGNFFSKLFSSSKTKKPERSRTEKPAMPTPRPKSIKNYGNSGTGNEVKAKKNYGMGMVDSLSKAKVKQGPPKPPAKKKNPGFLGKVKADFNKAVSETKRNFQGDAKKGTGRYKSVNERNLDSKGNYKGTNIKPTKLQESRMKKPEKNTMDFGAKKKKAATPMYESKGTKGGVKKSKYYSGGGTVFTGR